MHQDIHYCRSSDSTRIAYAIAGAGTPLLKVANWLSHLELDWTSPVRGYLLRGLAERYRLVRYDLRGTGLSQREVAEITPELWVDDLAAVADAAGLERFAILAMSQGGATAIRYAIRHPERVSHLILLGAYALGRAQRSPGEAEIASAMGRLIREGWGSENETYRRLFASLYVPDGHNEVVHAYCEIERMSATPEIAERIWTAINQIDVRDLLPRVGVPTLVMHVRDDQAVPFAVGRALAESIPGARLVPLPGRNHVPPEGDPAGEAVLGEIDRFLGGKPAPSAQSRRPRAQNVSGPASVPASRRLAAILAADVAGYSRLMQGDEAGTFGALKAHRAEVIDPEITAHGGRLVKTTGDGFLAEFPSVVAAVQCAIAIQRAIAARNAGVAADRRLLFRMGVNLGDVIIEEGDLYGDGVNVAARLEQIADAGGVCISDDAYRQVRGKVDANFSDGGPQALKNIAEPIRVWRWHDSGHAAPTAPPAAGSAAASARAASPRTGEAVGRERVPGRGVLVGLTLALAALVAGALWWIYSPQRESTDAPTAVKSEPAGASTRATQPGRAAGEAPASGAAPAPAAPAIAVLPFESLSEDPAQGYFADGFTDDLTTDLSKLSGLMVIARNSSFAYKGRSVDVRAVGEQLGARYLVQGSVRRSGARLRVNVALVDASSTAELWAERYDVEVEKLFETQDEIRSRILTALAVELTPAERKQLARRPTDDLLAYEDWLKGVEHIGRFTPEDNRLAREQFRAAYRRDPGFARAIAQEAVSHTMDFIMGWSTDPQASLDQAKSLARRAAEIDPDVTQVYWALSNVYARTQQPELALAAIDRSVELDPNFADGHAWRGFMLAYDGKCRESLQANARAMRINPAYPYWYLHGRAVGEICEKRFDDAAKTLREVLQRNPNWHPARMMLAGVYAHLGRVGDARWELEELRASGIEPRISLFKSFLPHWGTLGETIYAGLRQAGVAE